MTGSQPHPHSTDRSDDGREKEILYTYLLKSRERYRTVSNHIVIGAILTGIVVAIVAAKLATMIAADHAMLLGADDSLEMFKLRQLFGINTSLISVSIVLCWAAIGYLYVSVERALRKTLHNIEKEVFLAFSVSLDHHGHLL